jgi:hypothetical protein
MDPEMVPAATERARAHAIADDPAFRKNSNIDKALEPAVAEPPRDDVSGSVPIDHEREIDPDQSANSASEINRERRPLQREERRR